MALLKGYALPTMVKMEVAPPTGSTTIMVSPYDWVVYTNAGTIAAQTLDLPANPVDGQTFLISNFAQITALSLSPVVTGFTDGGTLAAGAGLFIAYSEPKAVWFVAN